MAAFRKIDVDYFDEDTLLETELYEPDPRDPGTVLNEARQKQTAVRSSMTRLVMSYDRPWAQLTHAVSRGDMIGALMMVLDDAPYGPNVEEAKVRPTISTYHLRPKTMLL